MYIATLHSTLSYYGLNQTKTKFAFTGKQEAIIWVLEIGHVYDYICNLRFCYLSGGCWQIDLLL